MNLLNFMINYNYGFNILSAQHNLFNLDNRLLIKVLKILTKALYKLPKILENLLNFTSLIN